MAETRTEALHQNAEGLDIQAPDAILSYLADAQIEAAKVVRHAIPSIARAALQLVPPPSIPSTKFTRFLLRADNTNKIPIAKG